MTNYILTVPVTFTKDGKNRPATAAWAQSLRTPRPTAAKPSSPSNSTTRSASPNWLPSSQNQKAKRKVSPKTKNLPVLGRHRCRPFFLCQERLRKRVAETDHVPC